MTANRTLFHVLMNANDPTATIPGFSDGSTTAQNARIRPQPSACAASSSTGTLRPTRCRT
nr:hypothetical protein [Kribbella sp. VKM Ac-2527]